LSLIIKNFSLFYKKEAIVSLRSVIERELKSISTSNGRKTASKNLDKM